MNFEAISVLNPCTKTINYCGVSILVPEHAQYLATAFDGKLHWYTDKPELRNTEFYSLSDYGLVATLEFAGDWQESMLKIT